MHYRILGTTGMMVSRLCFGSLTIGPLQANLPLSIGAGIITAALDAGVNFIDTAQLYDNYDYIREALLGRSEEIIVASKSYDYTYEGMQESVEQACRGIGRDYIDIFMLHEQTSRLTLKGHGDALEYLITAKQQGTIRAVGVSTHTVEVVEAAADIGEIDVIHPIFNYAGIGILGGTAMDMEAAIGKAAASGKGIYTMKALGGGHLSRHSLKALDWIMSKTDVHSVAVGMQSVEEVDYNCRIFSGQPVSRELEERVSSRQKRLLVEEWCEGCGICASKCPMQAISIDGDKATVNSKCVLCGYCGAHCPQFCLKII